MRVQVTFDCADPNALAAFWAELLHLEVEDNSEFVDGLVASGRMPASARITLNGRSAFREVAAVRDPASGEPRLYFQLVPEEKVAKNRVHLDIHVDEAVKEAEVERAKALGAEFLWQTNDRGANTFTMADPEGNEFWSH